MSRNNNRSPEAQAWRRLYNTPRWHQIRTTQLQAEPLCRACAALGKVTPATVCNHLDKDSKATIDGFYAGPFSSLCAPCHDAGEQKGESAGFTAEAGLDGWPLDPRHPANAKR